MAFLLGILAGIGLPVQTSFNTRLKVRMGNPFYSSLISFGVGLAFLILLLPLTGQEVFIPFSNLQGKPPWIFLGGVCGVIFLTCNIILFPKIGGIRTAILPMLGQIVMGILVDTFGLFRSGTVPLTAWRIAGAAAVAAGVIIVTMARSGANEQKPEKGVLITVLQIIGVGAGMLSAVQTAVNGYLGKLVESPLKSAVISFAIGALLLVIICIVLKILSAARGKRNDKAVKGGPWWMWFGGILGSLYVLANVYLSQTLGTGLTVIVVLTGTIAGGLIVDHFGLFGAQVKRINAQKIIGVAVMIAGIIMIRLI